MHRQALGHGSSMYTILECASGVHLAIYTFIVDIYIYRERCVSLYVIFTTNTTVTHPI